MEEYKVTYNYPKSAIYENEEHWLIGCEVVKAETYSAALDKFIEKHRADAGCIVRDIELLN